MGRPQKSISEEQLNTMYWKQGMSVLDVSRALGVSYETVRKRMHSLSIPRRPCGPAKLSVDRTECDNGHILDESNRYVSSSGRVTCRTCSNSLSRKHYFTNHKKCIEKSRARVAKDPETFSTKSRQVRLKKRGLTIEDYDAMLETQNNVCAVCNQAETELSRRGVVRALAVDHDHATGKRRGLLCRRCNCVLGMFDDNTQLFEYAIAYLSRYKGIQNAT